MGKNLVAKDNVQLVIHTKEKGYSDLIVVTLKRALPGCTITSWDHYNSIARLI